MLTYQDYLAVGDNEKAIGDFILQVIADHESDPKFRIGQIAGEFYRHHDPYQDKVEKWIYDANGNAIKDKYSPDYKLTANFHFEFTVEMVGHLLGNGISFDDPEIKKKLGGSKFDTVLQRCLTYSANDGKSYGLATENGVIPLCFACDNEKPYFAELRDEIDNKIKAGVRYWRIADGKPLIAIFYTIDGYRKFRQNVDENGKYSSDSGMTLIESGNYKLKSISNDVQGDYLTESENYSELPIVPLNFINNQSSIVGNEHSLLAYDLILSGFSNDAVKQLIYWILSGYDGMDKEDDMRFLRDLYIQRVIHNEENQTAEPRQIEAQYQAREAALTRIEQQLIRNYMAADTKSLRSGAITTVEIKAAYKNLDRKCDLVEECVREFVRGLLRIYGIDENATFHFTRPKEINESEAINAFIAGAQFCGDGYTTKKILEIHGDIDEFDNIQKQKQADEMSIFNAQSATDITNSDGTNDVPNLNGNDTPDLQEAIENAENATGKTLNGAQMQSLIVVIDKLADGKISESQAINILSAAIGIPKSKAQELVKGDE